MYAVYRYYNILSLIFCSDDDNRIVLKPLSDVSDCQRDYINACYVDVYEFILLKTELYFVS